MSRSVRAFCPGPTTGTTEAGTFCPGRLTSRDIKSTTWPPRGAQGSPPFVPAGNTDRDKRSSTWQAQDAAPLGFRGVLQGCSHSPPPPLFHFFHFKRIFIYLYGTTRSRNISDKLYYDRANKYIQFFPLHNTRVDRALVPGLDRACRLFDLLHGDHQKRLFTLNKPLSSIISLIKSPASSFVIPSRRCSDRSMPRMYSTYIGKGDQYEYINIDNKILTVIN